MLQLVADQKIKIKGHILPRCYVAPPLFVLLFPFMEGGSGEGVRRVIIVLQREAVITVSPDIF